MTNSIAYRDERQACIYQWVLETFGAANAETVERALRLVEEALELAQVEGVSPTKLHTLIDHVYAKPPGEASQEAGGVGTTLLAYCAAKGFSADGAELAEVERIFSKPAEHFRQRHNLKADAGVAERVSENGGLE